MGSPCFRNAGQSRRPSSFCALPVVVCPGRALASPVPVRCRISAAPRDAGSRSMLRRVSEKPGDTTLAVSGPGLRKLFIAAPSTFTGWRRDLTGRYSAKDQAADPAGPLVLDAYV